MDAWRLDFDRRLAEARTQGPRIPLAERGDQPPASMSPPGAPAVGQITEQGQRLFEAKRQSESRKAAQHGIALERIEPPPPVENPPTKTDS